MTPAFSTNAYTRYSIFAAIKRIAAIGYPGVELLADTPHLYPESVQRTDIDRLSALASNLELKVVNINANTAVGYYNSTFWEPLFEPSISHPDPELRRWRIAYTKKCIDLAETFSCPCVSVTSGRPAAGVSLQKSVRVLMSSLEEILNYAEPKGIQIGIEYEPGLLIENYAELASLLKEMEHPNLGANLDLGHSNVLGEDPEFVILGLNRKIFNIHLEDIKNRKHYHLIPGAGDIDFHRLFNLLKQIDYTRGLTVELYTYPHCPDFAAARALEYLMPLIP